MPRRMTTEEFIEKAKSVHGDTYDYSDTEYTDRRTKVTILCNKCNNHFDQITSVHFRGSGCPSCGYKSKRVTNEQFIQKANEVHGYAYDYSKTVYHLSSEKVIITCPKHGDFLQTPNIHLRSGCAKCKSGRGSWSYSDWEKAGNRSKNFVAFQLYLIKMFNSAEEFIKIGKTFRSIEVRLKDVPYKYDIIKVIQSSARKISVMEHQIQKSLKPHIYTPRIDFGGMRECFNISVLNQAKEEM